MSNDIDTNPEAATLRGKRPAKRVTPPPAPGGTPLSHEAASAEPVSIFEYMNERAFVLFDPRESAPVIEIGGHVPEADLAGKYVRSEFDASETLVPAGCVTGVSRVLWQQGQHVRRDVYDAYVKRYRPQDGE